MRTSIHIRMNPFRQKAVQEVLSRGDITISDIFDYGLIALNEASEYLKPVPKNIASIEYMFQKLKLIKGRLQC